MITNRIQASIKVSIIAALIMMCGAHAQTVHGQYNELKNYFNDVINPIGPALPGQNSGLPGPQAVVKPIQFDISPQNPGPYEVVTIQAQGYTYDLNRTTITWYINGEQVLQGIGRTRIQFETGAIGEPVTVRMDAVTQAGTRFSETVTLTPAHLDIAWESNTYTPPFYKGKALHSASTFLTFIALPTFIRKNGTIIPPEELVYKWKLGARTLVDQSGYGRQSIQLKNEKFIQPMTITVEVSDADNLFFAKKKLRAPVTQPEIVFYENHPLLGILYNHALSGNIDLVNQEITVLAEPYFFEGFDRSDIAFERTWRIDQNIVTAGESITLRPVGTAAGTSFVDLTMRSTSNILQSARNQFSVRYESSGSGDNGNPFGN